MRDRWSSIASAPHRCDENIVCSYRKRKGLVDHCAGNMPKVWACSSLDEELAMAEFVEMKIQMAVAILAEELNYARASEKLNITQPEMKRRITELESQLELQVFRVSGEDVEVTEAGQVFVNACRTFLSTRSRQGAKSEIRD
jgi:hypothetical protein